MKSPLQLLLALLGSAACLGQTLDVNYVPASYNTSYGVDGTSWTRGQTFTVGLDGLLAGIDLRVVTNSVASPVLWDVRSTTGGVPEASNTVVLASGSVLGTSLPTSASGTFYYFDLTSFNINVSVGEVLAITVRGTNNNTVAGLRGNDSSGYGGVSGYAGGSGFGGVPGGATTNWSAMGTVDFGIKTYVTAAVPEPATTTGVLGVAAALAWLLARRRVGSRV